MAKRRMFSEDIIETDQFLDMSAGAQMLYVHYCMSADDDGFLGGRKRVMRMVGADVSAYNELLNAGYILEFEDGIIAITHWKLNNTIKKDRYTPTIYTDDFDSLDYNKNLGYIKRNNTENTIITASENTAEEQCAEAGFSEPEKENASVSLSSQTQNNVIAENVTADDILSDLPPLYLSSGEEYRITKEDYEIFSSLYPEVNIKEEIKNMSGWLLVNKDKRRERGLMPKFINGWLKNRLNNPQQNSPKPRYNAPKPCTPDPKASYDIKAAQWQADHFVPKLPPKRPRAQALRD